MHSLARLWLLATLSLAPAIAAPLSHDVRLYGATGDGKTLDSPAINSAIAAAAKAGGGTVVLPAGRYRSASIRLLSQITLELQAGAVLLAVDSTQAPYDVSPSNPSSDFNYKQYGHGYQDFGHSHWRNSLIWAEGAENIAIVGPGRIDGDKNLLHTALKETPQGHGNKAIGLVNCRQVTLRDITIVDAGHFALLATGVDHLLVDNVLVDSGRDGLDIDSCRNVRITNTTINTSIDDAIVLKSSYALGSPKACENITITNCHVSGYDPGSYVAGTYTRTLVRTNGATGRIKLGTESTGGFRNIAVSNVTFDYSRGIALETVDGAVLEDVVFCNIVMRDVTNAPIFLRLGRRMRAPDGTAIGALRRVTLANIVASNVSPDHGILITGIPGHLIEDVTLSNITIEYRGGGTAEEAGREVAEDEERYPEPYRFGRIPAYGMFARHVRGLRVEGITFRTRTPEGRPVFFLQDVNRAILRDVQAPVQSGSPVITLREVTHLRVRDVEGLPDREFTGFLDRAQF